MDLPYLIRSGLGIPDYWHPYLELQTDFLSGRIGRYPVSMDAKAHYPGQLDAEGVPVVFLGKDKATSSLPVAIVIYGLGNHDVFIRTRDNDYYQRMMCALLWLKNHYVPLGEGIGWPNQEDIPVYGLKAPWFSGLVQGLALSLFLRAHQLDNGAHWSRLARQTWQGYHVAIESGGFCRKLLEGVIYEEYPGPELDCAFSGMCSALIGLWEAWQSGIVAGAEVDFNLGLSGLRCCLPRFTHGRWSLYSLNQCLGKPLLASPYYQRTNGLLAQVVGLMAGDPEFRIFGERWVNSSNSLLRRITLSLRIGLDRYIGAPTLLHFDKSKQY
jgi:hypothetical protein